MTDESDGYNHPRKKKWGQKWKIDLITASYF